MWPRRNRPPPAQASPPAEQGAAARETVGAFNPRRSSVLIVEDSPDDALVVARALQNFGVARIFHAETAEEALEFVSRQACDVALVDYGLPGLNGLRLLERLRKACPAMRIILVTGARDERVAVSAMKLGAADFIPKDELLTSGIVRALQTSLREAATDRQEHQRVLFDERAGTFAAAAEEVEWLLASLARGHEAGPRRSGERWDAEFAEVVGAFKRYLRESFRRFPEPALDIEDGLVRMLVVRGLSPAAVLGAYRSCLPLLALDQRAPPFHPALCLVRVLGKLLEQYQVSRSLEALDRAA